MNSDTGLIAPLVQSFFTELIIWSANAVPVHKLWPATEIHFDC
jgi:hypothetical protein